MLQSLAFYLFAAILVTSALMVVSARNPVHSVLFLILGFFNAAGLFVLLGAEFVALILVIVYVGAVAVLFLFVVMMLDISFADLRQGALKYAVLGAAIGAVFLGEMCMMYLTWPKAAGAAAVAEGDASNTQKLGQVIYTDYIYAFQAAGLILLVAMIGAIVLTFRTRPGVRRQKIENQTGRRPGDVMDVRKVTTGTGA